MIRSDFSKLKNFTYGEMFNFFMDKGFSIDQTYAHIAKVKFSFMRKVQKFRTLIGRPVRFNSLTDGTHAKKSMHYLGRAVDLRIGGKAAINWNKMVQHALTAGLTGIGYYPFWNTPGLHVDDRDGGVKLWKRLKNGKYVGFI